MPSIALIGIELLTTVYIGFAATTPIVTGTANPLVARYSASCPSGSSMRVRFKRPADTVYLLTPTQTCNNNTLTFLIAGMRASTQYSIQNMITSSTGTITAGPTLTFTTGAPSEKFVTEQVVVKPGAQTDAQAGIVLQDFVPPASAPPTAPPIFPTATDLNGNLIWYYDPGDSQLVLLARMLPGGNMLIQTGPSQTTLREIDLAWNKIRETNVTTINAQLAAKGFQNILNFNHEAIRLPNGNTAVLANDERLFTNVQGSGTVDVLGDMLLVLDPNFNVVWAWDAFAHMDVTRKAVLGEICYSANVGNFCPPIQLATQANDWLHCNSIFYTASDGNFIVSVRDQDWVIKIDYANGTGTGNVLWRLGNQGDFTMLNTAKVSSPWFSHQHDAEYEPSGGPGVMSLFDNGNARRATNSLEHSRGQALVLNEAQKTADILLNVDVGSYSPKVGSAQRLNNGNYHFLSGAINTGTTTYSQNTEVTPTGSTTGAINYALQAGAATYRSFRISDMYTPTLAQTTPIAKPGANRTANPGLVTLDGSASNDPNGMALTYAWTLTSKPAGSAAVMMNATAVKPTIVTDRAGAYVASLVVSNGAQSSPAATATITTNNLAPVANAGANATATMGSTVGLSGTASSDPNGDPLTYSWLLTSLPGGSAASLMNASTASPSFVADKLGTYGVQLTVTDPLHASATASVTVTVNVQAPVVNAGVNQTVNVATVVALDGSRSMDPNGLALSYQWSLVGSPAGSGAVLQNATSPFATFFADRVGTFTAQLVASNGVLSGTATLLVTTLDVPPVANAGANQAVNMGALVTLDGTGSTDAGGNALTYQWTLAVPDGSAAVLSNAAVMKPTFTADIPGTFTARLVVNDGYFNSSPSAAVIGTAAVPPAANAGPDQTVGPGAVVTLNGAGSTDPNGLVLSYLWSFVTTPSGTSAVLANPTSVTPTFTVDRAASYVVQLVVSNAFASSQPAVVTVTTDNVAAVANAGVNQMVQAGATVTLDGSESTDANGDALIYSWSLIGVPAGSVAVLSTSSSVQPSFVADLVGTYIAQLIVNDGSLNSPAATVTISTSAPPPVADAGPNQTVNVGSAVGLNGNGSHAFGAATLTYQWSFTAMPTGSGAVLSNAPAVNPTFVADRVGTYVLQLIVNDGTQSSAPATVTISTADVPPVADAGAAQTVVTGVTVQLDGSASKAAGGGALTYVWSLLSVPAGSAAALSDPAAIGPTFVADLDGTYVAQLIVSDGVLKSAPATVTVTSGPSSALKTAKKVLRP